MVPPLSVESQVRPPDVKFRPPEPPKKSAVTVEKDAEVAFFAVRHGLSSALAKARGHLSPSVATSPGEGMGKPYQPLLVDNQCRLSPRDPPSPQALKLRDNAAAEHILSLSLATVEGRAEGGADAGVDADADAGADAGADVARAEAEAEADAGAEDRNGTRLGAAATEKKKGRVTASGRRRLTTEDAVEVDSDAGAGEERLERGLIGMSGGGEGEGEREEDERQEGGSTEYEENQVLRNWLTRKAGTAGNDGAEEREEWVNVNDADEGMLEDDDGTILHAHRTHVTVASATDNAVEMGESRGVAVGAPIMPVMAATVDTPGGGLETGGEIGFETALALAVPSSAVHGEVTAEVVAVRPKLELSSPRLATQRLLMSYRLRMRALKAEDEASKVVEAEAGVEKVLALVGEVAPPVRCSLHVALDFRPAAATSQA